MRYQKVFTQIWNDEKFSALSPSAQRLFLYLITCPMGNLIGMFVFKEGYACEDLKCLPKDLRKDFDEVLKSGLIRHDPEARVLLITGHLKHNPITNPNQFKAAVKEIQSLPKTSLFQDFKVLTEGLSEVLTEALDKVLRYSVVVAVTDTVTEAVAVTEGSKQNVEGTAGRPAFEEIVKDLNQKTGKEYRHTSKQTKALIQARWNDGFREQDFFKVHSNMAGKWLSDPKMQQYLRPETLYGPKFESYLNTQVTMSDQGVVSKTTEKNIAVGKQWLEKKQEDAHAQP